MTTEPPKPKPKRRWLQYSLRTFFVLLTVSCVWLGVVVHQAHEQRKAVEWIEKMGGWVQYDYEFDEDGNRLLVAEPSGPKWLVELLGVDYFNEVVTVAFSGTQVSDLAPLTKLTSLQELYLRFAQVNDLTSLAKLTSLQRLTLQNTKVRKVQVEELRKALPNCRIYWSPPDPTP